MVSGWNAYVSPSHAHDKDCEWWQRMILSKSPDQFRDIIRSSEKLVLTLIVRGRGV
jgi:hypothetical protein